MIVQILSDFMNYRGIQSIGQKTYLYWRKSGNQLKIFNIKMNLILFFSMHLDLDINPNYGERIFLEKFFGVLNLEEYLLLFVLRVKSSEIWEI